MEDSGHSGEVRQPLPRVNGLHPYRQWMLIRYATCSLCATDVTSGAYAMGPNAAANGVDDFAYDPQISSGHHEAHLRSVLGFDYFAKNEVFWQGVVQDRAQGRDLVPHPFLLPSGITLKTSTQHHKRPPIPKYLFYSCL